MQYWLHVGMLVFGVGLVKLVACQAWSAMRQRGNTIDILGLDLGDVKGSASDAANLLLLRRRNMTLDVFVLTHVAIITAISLVVGKSITTVTDTGSVELLFDYPMNISMLIMDDYQNGDQGFGMISVKYGTTWAWLGNSAANLTPIVNEIFSGTFIIQDSRAEYGVNAQLSGQQIGGSVSCVDPSANILVDMTGFVYTGASMEVSHTAFNASHNSITGESLNSLFISLCEYTVTFSSLPQNDASGDGIQYINPSQPTVYLPPGDGFWQFASEQWHLIILTSENPVAICHDGCMTAAVWNTLLTWWGVQGNLSQAGLGLDIYCYGGVLSPVGGGDTNKTCPSLDGEIWNRTLALVLEAMIQTYPGLGNASQTLFAQADRDAAMVLARHHPVFGVHRLRCLLGVHGRRVWSRRSDEGIRSA